MKNLAGNPETNVYIRGELRLAGISVVPSRKHRGEVPYSIVGKLGGFTFTRAWYYWIVKGDVPLHVANLLYANTLGKKDVRVAGHCGCPPPEDWAFPRYNDLVALGVYEDFENMTRKKPMTT